MNLRLVIQKELAEYQRLAAQIHKQLEASMRRAADNETMLANPRSTFGSMFTPFIEKETLLRLQAHEAIINRLIDLGYEDEQTSGKS